MWFESGGWDEMKGFPETEFSRTGFGGSKSAYERDIQGFGGVCANGA